MKRILIGIFALTMAVGATYAHETTDLLNERSFELEAPKQVRAAQGYTIYPLQYQYITQNGFGGHIHTYIDCRVVTVATGPDAGIQGVYDLSGGMIASKTGPDSTIQLHGKVYLVYDYGIGTVYLNGKEQFAIMNG
jgi:hypothetical protein